MDGTKLDLVGKIDSYDDKVTAAAIIPKEDGVVAISHDKTIKIWMKRSNGQYWPSISHSVAATPVCMDFDLKTRYLAVGFEIGCVMDFEISEDYNKLKQLGEYQCHHGAVRSIEVVVEKGCVLSCGADSNLVCRPLKSSPGGDTAAFSSTLYQHGSPYLSLRYDTSLSSVYVGDSTGTITVIKMNSATNEASAKPSTASLQKVATLKRHTDGVVYLHLDVNKKRLYSSSLDKTIIVWNTTNFESDPLLLTGHTEVVRGMRLMRDRLISVGEDSSLISWDMNFNREPAAQWKQSDVCEVCSSPFYWNFKAMWENKTLGVRQHHCRRCGRALCVRCGPHNDVNPLMGFESKVRTCDQCHQDLAENPQESHITRHPLYHSVLCMDADERSKQILTVGKDKMIKIPDSRIERVNLHKTFPSCYKVSTSEDMGCQFSTIELQIIVKSDV